MFVLLIASAFSAIVPIEMPPVAQKKKNITFSVTRELGSEHDDDNRLSLASSGMVRDFDGHAMSEKQIARLLKNETRIRKDSLRIVVTVLSPRETKLATLEEFMKTLQRHHVATVEVHVSFYLRPED